MKLIKQFDGNDCGAACLAMICLHYKSNYSITKIRKFAGTDRSGTSLRGLITAFKKLKLDAKAMKGTEEVLSDKFPVPFIAHIQYESGYNHFVVVYKITKIKYLLQILLEVRKNYQDLNFVIFGQVFFF